MAWIALVRHGVTDWNLRGIIQGRTDIPLSEIGIKKLRETKLCDEFLRAKWTTSPLQRAMQTAAILNPNATPKFTANSSKPTGETGRNAARRVAKTHL